MKFFKSYSILFAFVICCEISCHSAKTVSNNIKGTDTRQVASDGRMLNKYRSKSAAVLMTSSHAKLPKCNPGDLQCQNQVIRDVPDAQKSKAEISFYKLKTHRNLNHGESCGSENKEPLVLTRFYSVGSDIK